jgi:hypothetical protein
MYEMETFLANLRYLNIAVPSFATFSKIHWACDIYFTTSHAKIIMIKNVSNINVE